MGGLAPIVPFTPMARDTPAALSGFFPWWWRFVLEQREGFPDKFFWRRYYARNPIQYCCD
ncbi:MAG: hypothetical protein IT448_07335 [Phycisphaerales bacterium]|nr:hypothetical protein [Phycisphaerales bacterium]